MEFTTAIYTYEVSYLEKAMDDTRTSWVYKPCKKVATFKELSRTDHDQHKLAMLITKTIRKFPRIPVLDENGAQRDGTNGTKMFSFELDDEANYDLTVRYIREMLVPTTAFGEQEKAEFLNDSGALYTFGSWLVGEKILPFFLYLHET